MLFKVRYNILSYFFSDNLKYDVFSCDFWHTLYNRREKLKLAMKTFLGSLELVDMIVVITSITE